MKIKRYGVTQRWSDAVVHNQTVYLVEVPTNLAADVYEQTVEVLASLEKTLNLLGSNKSKILMATIYLTDINTINQFNQVWDNWLPKETAPVRACVQVQLANPGYKVEVQLTAALLEDEKSS